MSKRRIADMTSQLSRREWLFNVLAVLVLLAVGLV